MFENGRRPPCEGQHSTSFHRGKKRKKKNNFVRGGFSSRWYVRTILDSWQSEQRLSFVLDAESSDPTNTHLTVSAKQIQYSVIYLFFLLKFILWENKKAFSISIFHPPPFPNLYRTRIRHPTHSHFDTISFSSAITIPRPDDWNETPSAPRTLPHIRRR